MTVFAVVASGAGVTEFDFPTVRQAVALGIPFGGSCRPGVRCSARLRCQVARETEMSNAAFASAKALARHSFVTTSFSMVSFFWIAALARLSRERAIMAACSASVVA